MVVINQRFGFAKTRADTVEHCLAILRLLLFLWFFFLAKSPLFAERKIPTVIENLDLLSQSSGEGEAQLVRSNRDDAKKIPAAETASDAQTFDQRRHKGDLFIEGGIFDVDRRRRHFQFQLEYRLPYVWKQLSPLFSATFTTRNTFYTCAGIAYDFFIFSRFVLTPSFAGGIYYKGQGKNLGYPLEFRSCIELAWITKEQLRLGAQFYHLSNASLGHRNPGVQCLLFFFAFPIP
jgi:hypothetical protein